MQQIRNNILSWCKDLEMGALEQAINVSELDCLVGNFCLMPDAHEGFGMPIGGVAALKDAICPNMVGVDIGCGMLAVKTSLKRINPVDIKKILGGGKGYKGGLRSRIPLGMHHHEDRQIHPIFDEVDMWRAAPIAFQELDSAAKQIGTLGGGNHFIEIQKASDGHIWFMIHSGSRNLGYKVADHYNRLAREIQKDRQDLLKARLAYLKAGSDEFELYIREMNLCMRFAYENRKMMAEAVKSEFQKYLKKVEFLDEINIHHNFASYEKHFGEKVWVHRKGATLASKETIGIIPGSQGAASYIVQGLGCPASFESCSHGAGRKISRKKALEVLDLKREQKKLNDLGVIHALYHKSGLDEAPSAYKDIELVMRQQEDLAAILIRLTPLAVVKG
ncbi:MAG: RtcB family protein [Deferribacteraceae bacterium]|jgi:tRNA-splicing ligase RtcB|nr:RtcB family protein [Deferribacteraceae bacterium]